MKKNSVGTRVLGPLFFEYCRRFYALDTMLRQQQAPTYFFLTRAGWRLELLLQRYALSVGCKPIEGITLPMSRLIAIKAYISRFPYKAARHLGELYRNHTLGRVLSRLLPRVLLEGLKVPGT
jgi:hypothetical protein